jgi:hypothetical protein
MIEGEAPPLGRFWGETILPAAAGRWRDVVTGAESEAGPDGLRLAELFATLPIAVLRGIA